MSSGRIKLWDKYFQPYLQQDVLEKRILQLAQQITLDYEGKRPVFLAVLNGSFMFASDLLKHIPFNCEIAFIRLSSYHGTESSGKVKQVVGLDMPLFGRHVIVIEDIVDTGLTLSQLAEHLDTQRVESLRVASLLFKPGKLRHAIRPDYCGFEIGNEFVVGYGLDYNGLGRQLPQIYKVVD